MTSFIQAIHKSGAGLKTNSFHPHQMQLALTIQRRERKKFQLKRKKLFPEMLNVLAPGMSLNAEHPNSNTIFIWAKF